MSCILVEDIFDELKHENKRLFDELLFSNKCLNKLIEFKINFDLHSKQFKSSLDSNDWLKFERLLDEFNDVVVKLHIRPKLPINSTVVSKEQLNTSSGASVKSFIESPVEVTDETHKNGLTVDIGDSEDETSSVDFEDAIIVDDSEYDAKEEDLIPENILEEKLESNELFQDIDENIDEEYVQNADPSLYRLPEDCIKPLEGKTEYEVPVDANQTQKNGFTEDVIKSRTLFKIVYEDNEECVPNADRSSDRLTKDRVNNGFKPKRGKTKRKVPIDANLFCDWPECEFATNNHNALTKHRFTHSEKKFVCNRPECEYRTYKKSDLKTHLMRHCKKENSKFTESDQKLLEQDYECHCGRRYSCGIAYNKHLSAHNDRTVKRFYCDFAQCNYNTDKKNNLHQHVKRHSSAGTATKVLRTSIT